MPNTKNQIAFHFVFVFFFVVNDLRRYRLSLKLRHTIFDDLLPLVVALWNLHLFFGLDFFELVGAVHEGGQHRALAVTSLTEHNYEVTAFRPLVDGLKCALKYFHDVFQLKWQLLNLLQIYFLIREELIQRAARPIRRRIHQKR